MREQRISEALQDLKIDPSAKATWGNKLTAALSALGITDKCFRFVIDGDMDIKLDPRLFQHGAPWFSFGKIDFKLCWNDDFDFVRRVLMSLCQMIS